MCPVGHEGQRYRQGGNFKYFLEAGSIGSHGNVSLFNGVRPSKAEHKEEGEQKDAGGRPRHPDTHWWAEEKKSKAGEEWSGRAAENWGVTGGSAYSASLRESGILVPCRPRGPLTCSEYHIESLLCFFAGLLVNQVESIEEEQFASVFQGSSSWSKNCMRKIDRKKHDSLIMYIR